ncbi:MAG: DinB family protein [Taibaiella sp.]|nr:DinB family protein [Taibaiella sp.]
MPTFKSAALLQQLEATVQNSVTLTQKLQQTDPAKLTAAPTGAWNALQILQHLNSYNQYYLPAMKQALDKAPARGAAEFKAGLLGNYFVKTMLPGSNGAITNAMKAPKDHIPAPQFNDRKAMADFITGQQQLLQIIGRARNADLTRIKVPISISRFLKIRLGDTLRFLVAHQQRHFVQLSNTLADTSFRLQ